MPKPDPWRSPSEGQRIGWLVLLAAIVVGIAPGAVGKGFDRLLSGIDHGDPGRISVGSLLILGVVVALVGLVMAVAKVAVSRYVLSAAAALMLVALIVRTIDNKLDVELLLTVLGAVIAAALTFAPPFTAHFQSRKAPRPPAGWGPPPGHQGPPPGFGPPQMPQQYPHAPQPPQGPPQPGHGPPPGQQRR